MASYSLNARLTTLENKISNIDRNIDSKLINLQNHNKNIISSFSQSMTTLDIRIKEMEQALQTLKQQYEENNKLLNSISPKVGQKRKWWQAI